ncbi:MAG: hypothetical protein KY461_14960, partial [Actinobacteria bacterium]|nr:hypothetical protein [Actinomycetota bacterium]
PGGSLEADMPALRDDVALILAGTSPTEPEPDPIVEPAPARSVSAGLALSTTGGRWSTNHLVAAVDVADVAADPDVAVAGVAVTVHVTDGKRFSSTSTATTSSAGTVQFSWKNVKSGTYTVTVTDVADPDWDGGRTSGSLSKV